MTDSVLIEIRCPYRYRSRIGKVKDCERMIVKVTTGSAGEGWCVSCKKAILFEVNGSDVKHSVKAL